jgi:hypothetical protein
MIWSIGAQPGGSGISKLSVSPDLQLPRSRDASRSTESPILALKPPVHALQSTDQTPRDGVAALSHDAHHLIPQSGRAWRYGMSRLKLLGGLLSLASSILSHAVSMNREAAQLRKPPAVSESTPPVVQPPNQAQ